MAAIDGFDRLPPNEQATWRSQYGDKAPYFWAAQTGALQVPQEAQGFYGLPPDQQATWYSVHGEGAATAWARQAGKMTASGTGYGASGTSPNPAAGTPYAPGQAPAYPGSTVVPGSGRGPGGEPLFGTTRNAFRGSRGGQFSNRMADVLANDVKGWFGSGFIDEGGNRHFLGRDDEGGPLGWGEQQTQYQRNAATGKMEAAGTRLGREDSGWDPAANGGKGGPRNSSGAYYGAQPFSFISGEGGLNGLPAAGQGSWVGLNRSYGSGGQGDPTDDAGGFDERAGYGPNQDQASWNRWVHTGRGGGGEIDVPPGGYLQTQYQQPGGGGSIGGGGIGGGGTSPTPQAQLFVGPGVNLEGDWSVLGNLLLRSDTESALNTSGIPPQYAPLIAQALKLGVVKATNRGWDFLKKTFNLTPQSVGGVAPQYASMVGVQADGSGAGTKDYGGEINAGAPGVAAPGQTPTGGTGGTGTPGDPRFGMGGTWQEGEDTPFGKIKGGLPGGFGLEWNRLIQEMVDAEANRKIEQAKLTGTFDGMPTVEAQQLAETIRHQTQQDIVARMAEDRSLQQQVLDEAFRRAELKLTQQKALGFVDGEATVEMQQFLAEQQQAAYERAANPAKAFENELARGATGWNTPGVNPGASGVVGLTAPGQTLQQWAQAGGFAQAAQPQQGATQPSGYGYGAYGPQAQIPGQNMNSAQYVQAAQPQAQAAQQAAAQPAANPFAAKVEAAPAMQAQAAQTGAAAQATPADPAVYAQGTAQGQTTPTPTPVPPDPQQQQQPAGAYGATGGGAYGSGGGNIFDDTTVANTLVRTPAAVNAFKAGTGIATTGNYGAAPSTLDTASQSAITPTQVRLQNLKQSRRLSPVARAVVGSFAGAGGTDQDTFKLYSERKAPKATTAAGGYNLR